MEPSSAAAGLVKVGVAWHAEGASVVYELPEPMRRVALVRSESLRRDEWRPLDEGVRIEDDALVSDEPRARFRVLIPPDSVELDRVYPSLHRVAGGVALYGPALLVDHIETRVELRPEAGEIAIPEQGAERGYAWVGPAEAVGSAARGRIVADPSVAPWLVEHVRRETEVALTYYERKLERPGRAPTMLVSMQSTMSVGYRGDASGTDVISLRFFDPRWSEPDAGAAGAVGKFVAHETFHLWNGENAADVPPWLHEGGAELAAIVASASAGSLTQEQALEQVSHHLGRCRAALGDRPLVGTELSGGAIYECGVALQWIADTEARATSQGQRDVFAIWRDLLRAGEDDGYTLEDLRAATGPTVAILLDGDGPERWSRLVAALAEHGATVVASTASDGTERLVVADAPTLAR